MEGTDPLQRTPTQRKRKLTARLTDATEREELEVANSGKPAAFTSTSELREWPLKVVQSLCGQDTPGDQELSLRLKQHFLRGIVLNTDYSGIDCPREALELAERSLYTLHGVQCVDAKSAVSVGRTCDKGTLQKKVQVALSHTFEESRRCHFEDLLDRLPETGREWIRAATPEKTASKAVRATAFSNISKWDRLASIFSKIAHVFSWHDGPELHGWPHRRRRVLAALISKETMEWLGSPSLTDLQADYKERFHRQMCADGSILLQASFEDRVQEMHTLAQLRKNNVSLEEMGNVMADSNHGKEVARLTLPPGGIDRLAQWEQEFKDRRASDQSLSGPVQLFNRNVDKCSFAAGPAGSRLWPTQLTHGTVIAFKTNEDGEVS
ncbi:Uncharacterized protein SCF082_LOCUS3512 [Durusdinium trenchii]|uniref:Uncharacterized protein n=1 Tax=Durusdinium trenchii TaxID=1381693 RepID=A0ABP0HTF6_9DINO